ncbi:MAG: hypothetical protein IJO64_08190, partial [Clostridia bacterium]|nr:hypothetical protein [Clostridia bacterium]
MAEKEGFDFAVPVFLFAYANRFGAKIRPLQLSQLAVSVPDSKQSTAKAVVYHSQLVAVYHQDEVLYIIIAKAEYSLRLMICTLRVMIYAFGDDIPLLSQWIKNKTVQRLSYFWRRRRDLILRCPYFCSPTLIASAQKFDR